jgi:hypothetical protein
MFNQKQQPDNNYNESSFYPPNKRIKSSFDSIPSMPTTTTTTSVDNSKIFT